METKYTPGPWKAYRRADYTIPGWVVLWPDTSKPGIHHRRLDSNGGFIEADARLIAAAPELLDACQAMIEWDAREQDHAVDFYARLDLCRLAFDKARAAIAKATGESK